MLNEFCRVDIQYRIEYVVTNGVRYHNSDRIIPKTEDRRVDDDISYQSKLGWMEIGGSSQAYRDNSPDLFDLRRMEKDITRLGLRGSISFDSPEQLMEALRAYQLRDEKSFGYKTARHELLGLPA